MKSENFKNHSLDFFKQSKIELAEKPGTFYTVYAMLLYTMYKIFNPKKLVYIMIFLGFIIFMHNMYISHENNVKKANEMQALLYKHNLETVNKISQEQIDSTLMYLDSARDKEISRLTQLYWIIKYIDKENDLPMSMRATINDIQKTIVNVKNHYTYRKIEILQAYSLVQQKKYNLLKPTYDDKEVLNIIVELVDKNKLKEEYLTEEGANLIHKYMSYVKKPEELNVYLIANKEKMKQEFVIFEK